MSGMMRTSNELSEENGISQARYKQRMDFYKKPLKGFIRLLPWDTLPKGYEPLNLDHHRNFGQMISKKGDKVKIPVRCRKSFDDHKACFACDLAKRQKEAAGNTQVNWQEDVSRKLSFFLITYNVAEGYDKIAKRPVYELDHTKPLRLELRKEDYDNLVTEFRRVTGEIQAYYREKEYSKIKKRLMKEHEASNEAELESQVGGRVLQAHQDRIHKESENITAAHPQYGVAFEMQETLTTGANGLKNKKVYQFQAVFNPDEDEVALPLKAGWDAEAVKYISNEDLFPIFENNDLEAFSEGRVADMQDGRFRRSNNAGNNANHDKSDDEDVQASVASHFQTRSTASVAAVRPPAPAAVASVTAPGALGNRAVAPPPSGNRVAPPSAATGARPLPPLRPASSNGVAANFAKSGAAAPSEDDE